MSRRAPNVSYTGGSNEAGNSVQSCASPEDASEDSPVTIRAAVFFDGTLNNRSNVSLGQQGIYRGESYKHYFSNISIMEKYFAPSSEYDYSFSIYIEGVGTTDEKQDSMIAAALGIGPTGVLAKVQTGVSRLITIITDNIKRGVTIDHLEIDSFGFSRGAAAARNFVHKTLNDDKTLKLELESIGYTVNA